MPPRRASMRRKKPASTNATPPPVGDHVSPTPKVELGANDAEKVVEPNVKKDKEDVDEEIPQVLVETSVQKEKEDIDEEIPQVLVEKEDLQESENVDEEKQGGDEDGGIAVADSQLEIVAELKSAQEDITAVQVDDFKILNDNNNSPVVNGDDNVEKEEIAEVIPAQESDISKSSCKNIDAPVDENVSNGDIKGTPEVVSVQESCENNTALTVEDDSTENMDNDESDDDIEGDDSENEGDEEPSLSDNKKDKNIEIYVGKLDKDTVEDDLVNVFQQFGELKSTRIMRNSTTKKSKGFAFIQFASVDQAKRALSELKDGVEVRGKRVMISASQDNKTLCLGNIHKTWNKEQVLQQLKHYGIEHIETIRVPEDQKISTRIKGFAFLEFTTHSDAVAAFQRLRKPDAVFGRDLSAKVAFAETSLHSSDEDLSLVNQVYLEGLTKEFNEEKVKEICRKYGEILKISLYQSTGTKHKDYGFVTFTSSESALACVEGINNTSTGGEPKIKANIAKPQQKRRTHKKGFRGGFKVEKQSEASRLKTEGEISTINSEPIPSKMKGVVLKSQQTKRNKNDSSKKKIKANTVKPQLKGTLKKDGESSKEAEVSKMKGDLNSQQAKRKRNAASEQKLNTFPDSRRGDQGTPKKPKRGGEGQNSKNASKVGSHKRKKTSTSEAHEDGGYKNAHGKKLFKKQKGNMYGRAKDNSRNPKSDTHIRRGRDDYRNTTRSIDSYAPLYAASSSDAYLAPDRLLATRRYKEMEPHAGYIEPAQSRTYSGYFPPVVRSPHSQHHQSLYREPASTSQSQSQLFSRYLDRPVLTQSSHRGYIRTPVAPVIQPYRDYRPSAVVHIAHEPYDPGLARVVRYDDRGAGVVTYAGGPPLSASQVQERTRLYQARGSYSGAYSSGRAYY